MKVDVKDKKILKELDNNPKITTSALAKKVRLSQQVVDYRINRLKKNGLISYFGTILNLGKLGFEQYRIFFQLKDESKESHEEIVKFLQTHKQVYWSASAGNKWDLLAVIFVKNYDDLQDFLDLMFKKFNTLKDYISSYIIYHEFYQHKFLQDKTKDNAIRLNLANPGKHLALDNIDKAIINKIKHNCRQSNLEISKGLPVSYKTVQNRIKRLEELNFIQGYRVFLNSELIGQKAFQILISFSKYGREEEQKLLLYASRHPNITQGIKMFGKWSVLLHVRTEDMRSLQQIIIDIRNRFSAIGKYEIVPIFQDYSIDLFPMSKEIKVKKRN